MSEILYAKPAIQAQIEKLKIKVQKYKDQGTTPYLKVLLVGQDPGSVIYTRNKKKFCEKVGAKCDIIKLPADLSEELFFAEVKKINKDDEVHGALIQLPLPKHLSHIDTTNLVSAKKDVDGFHSENIAKIYRGESIKKVLAPCTPKGIVTMLSHYGIEVEGKNVLIIGRSLIVGKPMSLIMTSLNATVTLAHSRTKNIEELSKASDIIITACGAPKKFNSKYFRNDKSQVIIDVGISRTENGLSGDCDFENIKDQVKAITPVPGGVGPMTIFTVTQNLLHALELSLNVE